MYIILTGYITTVYNFIYVDIVMWLRTDSRFTDQSHRDMTRGIVMSRMYTYIVT